MGRKGGALNPSWGRGRSGIFSQRRLYLNRVFAGGKWGGDVILREEGKQGAKRYILTVIAKRNLRSHDNYM